MLRLSLITLSLVACGESRLPPEPLPPLVHSAKAPAPAKQQRGFWRPGERMVWDIRFKGMSIGRAELAVGRERVDSRFRADKLFGARAGAHDLSTAQVAKPDGTHTVHSALGWVRAWATPHARASSLRVEIENELFEVDVASPVIDPARNDSVRVDAQASATNEAPVMISVWLSRDERRVPIRIELERGAKEVSASLVAYER